MSARLKAFLIHLCSSAFLAAAAVALVFLIWYPSPLAQAIGVTHVFLLMLAIDVIVGPLFTLLVYKVGKKTLKFDLATIIVLQVAMFGYGLYTVAAGRPAWLVFSLDQFYVVRATELNSQLAKTALPEYRHAPWLGPQWVSTHLPDDRNERRQLVIATLDSGEGLFINPGLYRPLTSDIATIRQKAQPLAKLQQFNPPEAVKLAIAPYPQAESWLPLWSNPQSMTVLLDKNGNVLSIVNLSPQKK